MGGKIWELDFYSRPILDENNKKIWEVLICESPQSVDQEIDSLFKYTEFCPASTVNSIWLKEAIEKAIKLSGESPRKIRFFRRQMKNMITKACEDAGMTGDLSRRTYALSQWLEQRLEQFYPQQPGYQAQAVTNESIQYSELKAIALPDALKTDKKDKWALVTLEAEALQEMKDWDIAFGEAFPLSLGKLTPQSKIPGLIIYSNRAIALAGWLSGLEMGFLAFEEIPRPIVRLETGANENWILVNITDAQTLAEAKGFVAAKEKANQVHFLAIQSDPSSEAFAGFWLLKG